MGLIQLFRAMMKLGKAPITDDERLLCTTVPNVEVASDKFIADAAFREFVESNRAAAKALWEITETHKAALAGDRNACYHTSLACWEADPERAYLWATVASLAGHFKASSWMDSLKRILPHPRRYYLETVARKWYVLNKGLFKNKRAEIKIRE